MLLTSFQQYMDKERWDVINKFQSKYKIREEKEYVLENMGSKDIRFLIYCSDS